MARKFTPDFLRAGRMRTILSLLLFLLALAADGQINRFAFPAIAGTRLRELNICNGTNDSGNGPTYGIPANFYDQDYYWTNAAGPSGNEWLLVSNQIVAAANAGANCVRLMWDATAFVDR